MPAVCDPSLTRRFNVRIPLRDGITLAADLVLPRQGPTPAVVMRTPYGRSTEIGTTRADAFAKAGYAAVWVDVRGRGDSEGAFVPYRNRPRGRGLATSGRRSTMSCPGARTARAGSRIHLGIDGRWETVRRWSDTSIPERSVQAAQESGHGERECAKLAL